MTTSTNKSLSITLHAMVIKHKTMVIVVEKIRKKKGTSAKEKTQ
jgi:hypothetical protein